MPRMMPTRTPSGRVAGALPRSEGPERHAARVDERGHAFLAQGDCSNKQLTDVDRTADSYDGGFREAERPHHPADILGWSPSILQLRLKLPVKTARG
jgi:hypothetical protein